MANRANDWLKQAQRDLNHAIHSVESKDYEWSCFSCQQAAEKAVKAVFMKLHSEAWGHSVTALLTNLAKKVKFPEELTECAKRLDKHYIPSRYPNGFERGIPADYYTKKEAEAAIQDAKKIIRFCKNNLGK